MSDQPRLRASPSVRPTPRVSTTDSRASTKPESSVEGIIPDFSVIRASEIVSSDAII